MAAEPPRRRHLTISVRSLMLLVLSVAAWLGWITHRARQQRVAVAAITQSHGSVRYDWEFANGTLTPGRGPAAPKWLRRALGDEYFQEVVYVDLLREARPVTWEVLGLLRELPHLRLLVFHAGYVTDEGDRNIAGLTGLKTLEIWDAKGLGDAGIAHLAGLKYLTRLRIANSRMTDLGLARLKGLTGLEWLMLPGNHLTDDGLAHIEGLKNLRLLEVGGGFFLELGGRGGDITDAGLVHLAGLTDLDFLDIRQSKVSDRGLEHLKGLPNLREIWVSGTRITDGGIKKLQEALPSLKKVLK